MKTKISKSKMLVLLLSVLFTLSCVFHNPAQYNNLSDSSINSTPTTTEAVVVEMYPELEMITKENYSNLEIIQQIQVETKNCNTLPSFSSQRAVNKIAITTDSHPFTNATFNSPNTYTQSSFDENTLQFSADGKKLRMGQTISDLTSNTLFTLDDAQNISYSPNYTKKAEYSKKVFTVLDLETNHENVYEINIDGDYFLGGIAWDGEKPYVLLKGRYESVLRMIDPITSTQILIFPDYKATPYNISFFFHEDMFIAARAYDKDLSVDTWNMGTKEKVEEFSGIFPKKYTFFSFNHSYSIIMANNEDDIYLWRYPGFDITQIIDDQFQAYPDNIVFNGNDQMVILHPYGYNFLRFWNTGTGDYIGKFEFPETMQINSHGLAISPDGKVLATNASDGSVYLWGVRK